MSGSLHPKRKTRLELTGLREASLVQSDLEEHQDIVAEVSKIGEGALKVVLKDHIDLENPKRLDQVVHLIMSVLAERGETAAQAGVFRD